MTGVGIELSQTLVWTAKNIPGGWLEAAPLLRRTRVPCRGGWPSGFDNGLHEKVLNCITLQPSIKANFMPSRGIKNYAKMTLVTAD